MGTKQSVQALVLFLSLKEFIESYTFMLLRFFWSLSEELWVLAASCLGGVWARPACGTPQSERRAAVPEEVDRDALPLHSATQSNWLQVGLLCLINVPTCSSQSALPSLISVGFLCCECSIQLNICLLIGLMVHRHLKTGYNYKHTLNYRNMKNRPQDHCAALCAFLSLTPALPIPSTKQKLISFNRSLTFLMREVLSGSVFLPSMDYLADPVRDFIILT